MTLFQREPSAHAPWTRTTVLELILFSAAIVIPVKAKREATAVTRQIDAKKVIARAPRDGVEASKARLGKDIQVSPI
jgi:hypothetical protein